MKERAIETVALRSFGLIVLLGLTLQAAGQDAKTQYPSMAPLEQYLMEQNAEIALARTAAPESLSKDAEIMALRRQGYETAVKGKNGFVCLVWRSWTAGTDDPDFWNPKLRSPVCFNAAAARSQIPMTHKKTEVILASRSKEQMADTVKTAFDRKELPTPEPGAMCYMMSKQQYLNDRGKQWHPHLMFFLPLTDTTAWGANSLGSPVIGIKDDLDRLTLFLITVSKWSDGTAAPPMPTDEH